MSRIKLFLVSLLLLQVVSTATKAQSAADRIDFKPTPYMFVGLQGGVQTTFAEISPFKLITPTASLSFGAFFNPSFGARLHFNGLWNKGGFEIDDDDDDSEMEYCVWLNDGTKVEFDMQGEWERVGRKKTGVPAKLIPPAIIQYVKANYPNDVVSKLSRKPYGYKIELSNDKDLRFNAQGQFIEVID